MARPKGFEPLTYGLEVRCSILLSYGRKILVVPKGRVIGITAKKIENFHGMANPVRDHLGR